MKHTKNFSTKYFGPPKTPPLRNSLYFGFSYIFFEGKKGKAQTQRIYGAKRSRMKGWILAKFFIFMLFFCSLTHLSAPQHRNRNRLRFFEAQTKSQGISAARSKFGNFSSQNASQPQKPHRYRKKKKNRLLEFWTSLWALLAVIQCRWPYKWLHSVLTT